MLDENPNGSYRIIGVGTKVRPIFPDPFCDLIGTVTKINRKIHVTFPDRKRSKAYWSHELANA